MDTSRRIDDWLKGSNGSPPPTQEEILNTTKMVMKGLESLQVEHTSILGDATNTTATDAAVNAKNAKNQMNEVGIKDIVYSRSNGFQGTNHESVRIEGKIPFFRCVHASL